MLSMGQKRIKCETNLRIRVGKVGEKMSTESEEGNGIRAAENEGRERED